MHDLVIRRGTVVDGTGAQSFAGDVAIDGGRIAAVGDVGERGREEIEAEGHLVTPGFVDVHTHYDGQVSWDPWITPSSWHGVTSVVMGNCGVGFAPASPDRHDWLIGLMEGVEDIPGTALAEGISWEWESFPEYMDAVERVPHAIDIGAQVPHGALRAYVMGERGADHTENATASEVEQMSRLVYEAIEAGALGFTTSRTMNHRTKDGAFTPSLTAPPEELLGIGQALGKAQKGVFEIVSDFLDTDREFSMMRQMAAETQRTISISIAQADMRPDHWREILSLIGKANEEGIPMKAQVLGRPVGLLLGWEGSLHPFLTHPTYRKLAQLPIAERLAKLADPEIRARILSEEPEARGMAGFVSSAFRKIFALGDPPDYEPAPETSVAAMAERAGVPAAEMAYDMLMRRGGHELLYFPLLNYTHFNLDVAREMMLHPHTVFGLGDGGAHCGVICDGSAPTYQLTHWCRDRTRGDKLPLELIVRRQTRDTAHLVGLSDRGVLAAGMKADVNVIDFDRLRLHPPEIVYDLPAGGRRLIQRADGYRATIVSGEVVFRDSEPTGALPGRLIRGPQAPLL